MMKLTGKKMTNVAEPQDISTISIMCIIQCLGILTCVGIQHSYLIVKYCDEPSKWRIHVYFHLTRHNLMRRARKAK